MSALKTKKDPRAYSLKLGEFIEEIRLKREFKSKAQAAKAIGIGASSYVQIVAGQRADKPSKPLLKKIKKGLSMTPAEVRKLNRITFSRYKKCKFWPDVTITDEQLLNTKSMPEFIGLRLRQIGKAPATFAAVISWSNGQLSDFINKGTPTHRFDDGFIKKIISCLQLSDPSLEEKLKTLNAERLLLSDIRRATSVFAVPLKPKKSITEQHLLSCTSLWPFLDLALKRKGMSQVELERQTDARSDFLHNVAAGLITYRLNQELIYRLSDILGLSAHERMHFITLNAERRISHPRVADPSIKNAHILSTESFDACIKAKAIQKGISIAQICKKVQGAGIDITFKKIESILTQGRRTRIDSEVLRTIAGEEILDMEPSESAHLLRLNDALPTFEEFLSCNKHPQPIPQEELLVCVDLPSYLDLKLSQLGMSYKAFAAASGKTMGYAQKIVTGERANIKPEEVDTIIGILDIDDIESTYVRFLCDIYIEPDFDVYDAQEEGNMMKAFFLYSWQKSPNASKNYLIEELACDPQLSKWRAHWDLYWDIGFPNNSVFQIIKRLCDLSEQDSDLLGALSASKRASVRPSRMGIESVFEATDLFDSLMVKAKEIGGGVNTMGLALGGVGGDYATIKTSYDSQRAMNTASSGPFRSGRLSRGLEVGELVRMFEVLGIQDLEEKRHIALLNGIIWERYRKKRFPLFPKEVKELPHEHNMLGDLPSRSIIYQPAYTPFHDILRSRQGGHVAAISRDSSPKSSLP